MNFLSFLTVQGEAKYHVVKAKVKLLAQWKQTDKQTKKKDTSYANPFDAKVSERQVWLDFGGNIFQKRKGTVQQKESIKMMND